MANPPSPDLQPIPPMDIGGSHVTAALADLCSGRLVPGSTVRSPVDPAGSRDAILARWIGAARRLPSRSASDAAPAARTWGVAMPGPFDYDRGVGRFTGVGKFTALAGVDVGAALADGIGHAARIRFSNDADAFAVGEWLSCPEPRPERLVGITLGTGVGTGFVDNGTAITDGDSVPPEGSAYRLEIGGRPLEDTATARAVLAAYNAIGAAGVSRDGGDTITTVRELTRLARAGDRTARDVFHNAWRAAAGALAPYITAFGATVVVVGGAIAGSWDLVGPALLDGLRDAAPKLPASIDLRRSDDPEAAALLGAAFAACMTSASP